MKMGLLKLQNQGKELQHKHCVAVIYFGIQFLASRRRKVQRESRDTPND